VRSSVAVVSAKIGGKRDTGIGNFEFVQTVTLRQVGESNSCDVEPTNVSTSQETGQRKSTEGREWKGHFFFPPCLRQCKQHNYEA